MSEVLKHFQCNGVKIILCCVLIILIIPVKTNINKLLSYLPTPGHPFHPITTYHDNAYWLSCQGDQVTIGYCLPDTINLPPYKQAPVAPFTNIGLTLIWHHLTAGAPFANMV